MSKLVKPLITLMLVCGLSVAHAATVMVFDSPTNVPADLVQLSPDYGGKRAVEVESATVGMVRPCTIGGGGGACSARHDFREMTVSLLQGYGISAHLLNSVMDTSPITLHFDTLVTVDQNQFVMTKITLTDAYFTSFTQAGTSNGPATEVIKLAYSKICVASRRQNSQGGWVDSNSYGWDLIALQPYSCPTIPNGSGI